MIPYEDAAIYGTLIVTGGNAYGQCEAYTDINKNITEMVGGDVGSYGAIFYKKNVTIAGGANVKLTSAIYICEYKSKNGNLTMNGGWLKVEAAIANEL